MKGLYVIMLIFFGVYLLIVPVPLDKGNYVYHCFTTLCMIGVLICLKFLEDKK